MLNYFVAQERLLSHILLLNKKKKNIIKITIQYLIVENNYISPEVNSLPLRDTDFM
jgi:hypothetical protein